MRFIVFGGLFLALSIAAEMLVGGPHFISHLLTPRAYSFTQLYGRFVQMYAPLGLPLVISAYWSFWQFQNPQVRVISFYFFSSLLIGLVFAGGQGVDRNVFFDNFFSMAIIMGVCLDLLWKAPISSLGKGSRWRFLVPVMLYSSVLFIFAQWGSQVPKAISAFPDMERQFDAEVSFLAAQPGPAICESLIRCYDAGKPYILDAANSARLVEFGKLNGNELVKRIAEQEFGAIQTNDPVARRPNSRFPNEVLDAIDRYYVMAIKDTGCFIYIPRPRPEGSLTRP